jgi:LuxR family transcriptional regulator
MIEALVEIGSQFEGTSLEDRLDRSFRVLRAMGFTSLTYDFTPSPIDRNGVLATPSIMRLRDIPTDAFHYWCERGYYQIDPVQQLSLSSVAPFVWSYRPEANTILSNVLGESHRPVLRYLLETEMTDGVTVPVHMPSGGYATFSAICIGAKRGYERDLSEHVAAVNLLAHIFHASPLQEFREHEQRMPANSLTRRERECLQYSAEGLSAKQIAQRLDRSVATVVMHLGGACRKLGARNRTQAVAYAVRLGLIKP